MTTTKTDIAAIYDRRAALGPVWLIGPAVGSGWTTSGWSPVDYAVDEESADRVAEWLVEASGMGADPKARAWIVQARKLIKPLLLVARHSGGGVGEFVRLIYEAPRGVRACARGASRRGL